MLAQGLIDRVVGVGAAVGLDVGVVRAEELAGPLPGDVLHHVHALAAAVVPLAGVALGVLVGEHRGRRRQHRLADKVLRGDELDVPPLAVVLRRTAAPTSGSCAARNSMISLTNAVATFLFLVETLLPSVLAFIISDPQQKRQSVIHGKNPLVFSPDCVLYMSNEVIAMKV